MIKLSELIGPGFAGSRAAVRGGCTELIEAGGRGSGKSSYLSIELLLQLIKHPGCHAAVLRKVGATLRTSVYPQLLWAVQALGLGGRFRFSLSPMEAEYLPTGQRILFLGMDDAGKLKSLKMPFGYIGIVWFEELDQFEEEEVRSAEQSLFRGGEFSLSMKSYNPPMDPGHWVNGLVHGDADCHGPQSGPRNDTLGPGGGRIENAALPGRVETEGSRPFPTEGRWGAGGRIENAALPRVDAGGGITNAALPRADADGRIENAALPGVDAGGRIENAALPKPGAGGAIEKAGRFYHHSTYLELPGSWLGPRFLADARHLEQVNPPLYRHEYLGLSEGVGDRVFPNMQLGKTDFGKIRQIVTGVDWGWWPDPWACVRVGYDSRNRVLYIFREARCHRTPNRETAQLVKAMVQPGEVVMADSAEKKSIAEYRALGLNCRGAKKGPGSVAWSVKWLQSLSAIVIDPEACPYTAREFASCRYQEGRLPETENHHIDAVRYATSHLWRSRG